MATKLDELMMHYNDDVEQLLEKGFSGQLIVKALRLLLRSNLSLMPFIGSD